MRRDRDPRSIASGTRPRPRADHRYDGVALDLLMVALDALVVVALVVVALIVHW